MSKRYIVNWEKTEHYRTEVVAESKEQAMNDFVVDRGYDEFVQTVMNVNSVEESDT